MMQSLHRIFALCFLWAPTILLGPVECFISRHSASFQSTSLLKASTSNRKFNNNPNSSRRDQLHRVIRSIDFYGQDPEDRECGASKELIETMRLLSSARTQNAVTVVGRKLAALDIVEGESRAVQERVIKATALAGLLHTSLDILGKMLDDNYLPSHMSYTAVCSALRRAGRNEQLEELLYKMARVASHLDTSINTVAFNTYLASVCSLVENPQDPTLGRATNWLQAHVAKEKFRIEPDRATYNTVLHTAARVGNRTLVEAIWNELTTKSSLTPDIRSYNARLMATHLLARLEILTEIEENPEITPDRYTINLLIFPLIRTGRIGDVEELLDNFVARNSQSVVKDAFSAFLITLVQRGEISSARALFDTYILPCLPPKKLRVQSVLSPVRPDTRHFNILIDGYRRLAELGSSNTNKGKMDDEKMSDNKIPKDTTETEEAKYEGRKVFRLMRDSGIKADAYTLTSMMGLCRTTKELFQLLQDAGTPITPVVIRAAITACGRLGDSSSACVLFDKYGSGTMNVRVWNVLLGALSDGAKEGDLVLDVHDCMASKFFEGKAARKNATQICGFVDGLRSTDSVRTILDIMREDQILAPFPNSQSYCIAASALQYSATNADVAMELFRNATDEGIPADGRFVNAVFRCFGDDIDAALSSWKNEIRKSCLAYESRTRRAPISAYRSTNKNLLAAYNGLLYVCGRALRPDIALRLAYAMNKEGLEPKDVSLNNYKSGKRIRQQRIQDEGLVESSPRKSVPKLLPKINMVDQYENLLYVECTKYDRYSKRMSNDKRVRIIV